MRKFIWVTLILLTSVFIYSIGGDKNEKMPRSEDRTIRRNDIQQVNNAQQNAALKIDENYTSLSLILGGMPFNTSGNQAVMNIFGAKATKRHVTAIERMWKTLEGSRLKKMRAWRTKALENFNQSSHNLIYPFSGPDFLHAYTLFPNCDNYVLFGNEPVGKLPTLKELNGNYLNAYLGNVRNALRLFSQRGYFSTQDTKKHLAKLGTLPVLSVLLARTDNHISKVQYIKVNAQGAYEVIPQNKLANAQDKITGVMIDFLNVEKVKQQHLIYLTTAIAQEKNQKSIARFIQRFDHKIAMVKAGEYLLHQSKFTTLKNALLEQAEVCFQDDTGVPFKGFAQDIWNFEFYGRYVGAPTVYNKRYYQNDLRLQYRKNKKIKPLPFAFGYLKQGANMLIAQRKNQ